MSPDVVRDPLAGPDSMFSTDLPPSRGQWHALAVLALKVLRVPVPTSRYEATVAAVRLHRRLAEDSTPTTDPLR
jgi:hypothetical protein